MAAPPFPSKAPAAALAGRPALMSAGLSTGICGDPRSAAAASPSVVASVNGMANHAMPPMRYALTEVAGREAMARCQYLWFRIQPWVHRNDNCALRLVLKHGREVSDSVYDTEHQTVAGAHGQVRAVLVAWNWRHFGCLRQEGVHLREGADLVRGGVHRKEENQDDDVQDSCMRTEYAIRRMRRLRLETDSLVTQDGRPHSADDDVDGNAQGDEETGGDRVHAGQTGDGRRASQDQHRRNDDIRRESASGEYNNLTTQEWASYPKIINTI
jgi:hypothetical protein